MHLLFVGDTAVGKSHILHTLTSCNEKYDPKVTIGINYKICDISNKKYYLWDLPGSHRLFKLLLSYVRRTFQYNFIVCHINNENSIKNIDYYIDELKKINCNSEIQYHILINTFQSTIGNKESNIINSIKSKFKDKVSVINSFERSNIQDLLYSLLKD